LPVLKDGKLVGIVSRANLVQALASIKPTAQPATATMDNQIRELLYKEMRSQSWAFAPTKANVVVQDGEVHFWGYIDSESARRALIVMAENIPGVRRVEDHMDYPPVYPSF
jgi:osmotically-inducible protein OsmY